MINICKKFNLRIFDVEILKTAGGSLRYFICRDNNRNISNRVKKQLRFEKKLNLKSLKTYKKFKEKCEKSKYTLISKLKELKRRKNQL